MWELHKDISLGTEHKLGLEHFRCSARDLDQL